MIYTILDLGLAILLLFWVTYDITNENMSRKYYWGWMTAVVIGYVIWTVIGVLLVVTAYYIWSRYHHSKEK